MSKTRRASDKPRNVRRFGTGRFYSPRLEKLEDRTVPAAAGNFGDVPLAFEANRGQTDASVQFLSRGPDYTLFLTKQEAVLRLQTAGAADEALRMSLVGSNPNPLIHGIGQQPGRSNYFIGDDNSSTADRFDKVEFDQVYSGIDVVYYGNDQQHLEYDFITAPGADTNAIGMRFDGTTGIEVNASGELVLHMTGGDLVQHAAVAYQLIEGQRVVVTAHYRLNGDGTVGFELGEHDASHGVIIDPVMSFTSFFVGNNSFEYPTLTATSSGIYLAGMTASATFPTTAGVLAPTANGNQDAFVAKLDTTGTSMLWATYLGGTGNDIARGIAVDSFGDVYLTGSTTSADFPTSVGAIQPAFAGQIDAFITRLSSNGGSIVYSTYLGTDQQDIGYGIAVNSNREAYVTGKLGSDALDTAGAYQAFQGGVCDAFVAKLGSDGSLGYLTYLGGGYTDIGMDIAVDSSGNAYVTGNTNSPTFPRTAGVVQTSQLNFSFEAFIVKVNPTGSGIVYGTFVGGSGDDFGYSIAIDSAGNAYITGSTQSSNFPVSSPIQSTKNSNADAFVTKINATATAYIYSTYLGGDGVDDQGRGIAVDSAGNAFVVGFTNSSNFPLGSSPMQSSSAGGYDGFVVKLNPAGSTILTGSYFGAAGNDVASDVAVDGSGNAYLVGQSQGSFTPYAGSSKTFGNLGTYNTFVTKISEPAGQAPTVATAASASTWVNNKSNLSVLGADDGGEAALTYTWSSSGPAAVTFSANGTNAAKNSQATFTQPGSYTLTVTIADAQSLTVTSSVVVIVPNQAPTVATVAAASTLVNNKSNLSALGADDSGEAALKYTWSSSGPASVTFSANGTNAAKNSQATFTQPGSYTLTVTIADAQNLTVTSSVIVTVPNQAPTVATAASASTLVNNKANLSVLGADDSGEAALKYTWSSTGPAAVTFSANGTNAAKNSQATFTQPGSYTLTVTIADAQNLTVTSSVVVIVPNQAPTVATAASASTLVNNKATLSVLGADDSGEAALKYTWSSSGPAAVTFSANGTNAAKNSQATFTQPGSYTLTVTIADAQNLTVTSSVVVIVPNQAPTVATAAAASTLVNNKSNLSALGADDSGEAALKYTWSSSGPASVTFSANGTNAAKNSQATFTQPGSYTLTATIADAQNLTVTSSVVVIVPNQAPTVAAAAAASSVVNNKSALSVLGADDSGEAALTYTWSSSGPASVTFSANGTNAAKSTQATFTQAGSYTLTATIRDAQNLAVTSSVVVIVGPPNQAPTVATAASASTVANNQSDLSVLGADDGGEPALTYSWSSSGPAGVTFSANGSNPAKNSQATFTQAGSYTLTVTIADPEGSSVTSSVIVTVNPPPNQAPTVATAAAASSVVNNKSTLSVLGADDSGEAALTYTWSSSGPAAVTFSANGSNAAKNSQATFTQTGSYTLTVTIADTQGLNVASSVIVIVNAISTIPVTHDLIGQTGSGQIWVGASTGSAFSTSLWSTWAPSVTWVDMLVGDFNGDGIDDVAARSLQTGQWWVSISDGTSFTMTQWAVWSPAITWLDLRVGDFNGDGKADIAGRAKSDGRWWVALSNGSAFTTTLWSQWSAAINWAYVTTGDVNGDGKTDILGRYQATGQWWVNLSSGTAFSVSLFATWAADRVGLSWVDIQVADFNGDGKDDLAARFLQTGQWWVTQSNGSVGGATTLWATWSTAITWVDVDAGDMNGDGKADLIGRASAQGGWWLNASSGTSFTMSLWATWAAGTVRWVDVQLGDFDGDGKLDIAGRYQQTGQWWVSLSGGSTARSTTLWATWSPTLSLIAVRHGKIAE